MIYLVAFVLSLIFCIQSFAIEILNGNIGHLKNGRPPNAGAALFPAIPFIPVMALGATWLLQTFLPQAAWWIVLGAFVLYTIIWLRDFRKLQLEFRRLMAEATLVER